MQLIEWNFYDTIYPAWVARLDKVSNDWKEVLLRRWTDWCNNRVWWRRPIDSIKFTQSE